MTTKPSFACSTRQSIETVYHGPTNHRGSRITARSSSGNAMTVPYDHALSAAGNHEAAAAALADKLGWDGRWAGGSTRRGYVFADASRAE